MAIGFQVLCIICFRFEFKTTNSTFHFTIHYVDNSIMATKSNMDLTRLSIFTSVLIASISSLSDISGKLRGLRKTESGFSESNKRKQSPHITLFKFQFL